MNSSANPTTPSAATGTVSAPADVSNDEVAPPVNGAAVGFESDSAEIAFEPPRLDVAGESIANVAKTLIGRLEDMQQQVEQQDAGAAGAPQR
jgi:hypothetical protein